MEADNENEEEEETLRPKRRGGRMFILDEAEDEDNTVLDDAEVNVFEEDEDFDPFDGS